MTKVLLPAAPGTINIRGFGVGFPGLHNQSRAAGNGFININREIYYVVGVVNNTATDSTSVLDWFREQEGFTWWDDLPLVYTFYHRLLRINGNQSAVTPGVFGGLPGWSSLLGFDQWLTNTARKRAGILVLRDAGGVITWYLSWSNGTTRNQLTMLAIPNASWVSLIWTPSPRRIEVFVNGNSWAASTAVDLPSGTYTDNILFSLGVGKKLIDATEVSTRVYAPMIAAAREVN